MLATFGHEIRPHYAPTLSETMRRTFSTRGTGSWTCSAGSLTWATDGSSMWNSCNTSGIVISPKATGQHNLCGTRACNMQAVDTLCRPRNPSVNSKVRVPGLCFIAIARDDHLRVHTKRRQAPLPPFWRILSSGEESEKRTTNMQAMGLRKMLISPAKQDSRWMATVVAKIGTMMKMISERSDEVIVQTEKELLGRRKEN